MPRVELARFVGWFICGHDKAWRNGHRNGQQRWLCKNCGREYLESLLTKAINRPAPDFPLAVADEKVERLGNAKLLRVQGGTAKGEKMQVAEKIENGGLLSEDFGEKLERRLSNPKILQMALQMWKNGVPETTISGYVQRLMILSTKADLYDPESVKEAIARGKGPKDKPWTDGYKSTLVYAYDCFLKFLGGSWERPKYKQQTQEPWIPPEQMIDQLIANAQHKTACFVRIAKETGARPGEIKQLRWIDVDVENSRVSINFPEKGSNPRTIKVSTELIRMINSLPKKGEKIFNQSVRMDQTLRCLRRRLAYKLQDERFNQIDFITLRHFKGTWEYYYTKDIRHVQYVLGHKNIKNTMIYVQIVEQWEVKPDRWVSKVADNA